MTLVEVMETLKSKAKPTAALIYAKHGVTDETWGVSYSDMGSLVKRLKVDQTLSMGLWASGIHDARVLATMLADPARMTRGEIESWLGECGNYVITGAVATVAARMPQARELAKRWIEDAGEHISTAGWAVIGALAGAAKLEEADARKLIGVIRSRIHGAKNRTRHSMNGALIAIGGAIPALRDEALAAAKVIGTVEVDHGETGCKTPDAASYIVQMADHATRKASAGTMTGRRSAKMRR